MSASDAAAAAQIAREAGSVLLDVRAAFTDDVEGKARDKTSDAKTQERRLASFADLIGRISQHARQGSRLSVQVSEHIHHQAQQIPRILSQA